MKRMGIRKQGCLLQSSAPEGVYSLMAWAYKFDCDPCSSALSALSGMDVVILEIRSDFDTPYHFLDNSFVYRFLSFFLSLTGSFGFVDFDAVGKKTAFIFLSELFQNGKSSMRRVAPDEL